MKKYTILFFILVLVISGTIYSQSEKIKLAVSKFDTLTAEAEKEDLGSKMSAAIENGFVSIDRFEVRKTGAVQNYVNQLAMSQLGILNPDVLKGKGKSLNINYITVGSVGKFGNQVEADVRTVDINNWTVIFSSGCTSSDIGSSAGIIRADISSRFKKEKSDEDKELKIKKSTISVYKFSDDNIMAKKAGYGGVFSEILNSELGTHEGIAVIERVHAKKLLNEKRLEMTGIVENDNSDSYFMIRGISYKFIGNIKVFRDIISINYSIINTNTHSMVFMGHTEIGSSMALRPAAKYIAKVVEDSLNNRIGTLKIAAKPLDSLIMIDNEPAGNAPILTAIEKGKHSIRISYPGYETTIKEINIVPNKINMLSVDLELISRKLLNEAFAYENKGLWENAVEMYKQFITKYNDTVDANQAYYRMGHIQQFYLKKYDDAIKSFEGLIKRYPDAMTRAEAYYGLAQTYRAMGNNTSANDTIKILIEKYPNSFAAEEAKRTMK